MEKAEISITSDLEQDIKVFKNIFKDDDTVKFRSFSNKDSSIKACIIFIAPMVEKEDINKNIILPIMKTKKDTNVENQKLPDFISTKVLNINNVQKLYNVEKIIKQLMAGATMILFEGSYEALIVETKGWETRAVTEPESDTVIRGPREGFNESIETNISLIRRKINSTNLKFKYSEVGLCQVTVG